MGLFKQEGSKVWWMDVHFRWRRIRESTGVTNKKLAEQIYCRRKSQFVEDTYLDDPLDKTVTFDQMVERYGEEVSPEKADQTQSDERRYTQVLLAYFGGKFLHQINASLVAQFKQHRKLNFKKKWQKKWANWDKMQRKKYKKKEKDFGKRSINRELSLLSAMFTQAIKVWGWLQFNPVSCIKRERAKEGVAYFPPEVFEKIWEKLPEWIRPIALFSKNTGLRRTNVVNLQWSEVNLDRRFIVLQAEVVKNSKHLGIPLTNVAYEILMERKDRKKRAKRTGKILPLKSRFVFCKENGKPYTVWGVTAAFKRACEEAGYPDYCFHDLRHDYASKLVQEGVDIFTVKELVGHKDISTTQRYAHLSPERLRNAVSVLDCHSFVIVDKKRTRDNAVSP